MQFSIHDAFHGGEANGAADGFGSGRSVLPEYEHPMTVEQFRERGYEMVDFICDYYQKLEHLPVRSAVQPGYLSSLLPDEAPKEGEAWNEIMSDVRQKIMPGLTHWQSPNFFGYFPCNSSFPAILGDLLCTGFATQNFSWIGSPAATELESIVLDWLGKLLGLPHKFLAVGPDGQKGKGGGVIQGTASESTLVCLLAAKAKAMAGRPAEDAAKLVVYTSDQAHSSVKKACMIAGVHHARVLPTTAEHEWALQPETLQNAIEQDLQAGLIPAYLTATVGTTSTGAVDPVRQLGEVARQHGLWMHVDAAYAGAVAVLPELREYFDGLELAHSFNMNAHKWLLTNFDCSALWVADAEPLKEALSMTPAYLRAQGNALDFKDWQIPLGRRFRALKLWFVLRTYGQQGLQAYIRHHLRLTQAFEEHVQQDARFELTVPPRFGLVCFRLKGASNAVNAALLETINASGKTFMVHTEVGGTFMLRFALGSTFVQQQHVEAAWKVIATHADKAAAQQGAGVNNM